MAEMDADEISSSGARIRWRASWGTRAWRLSELSDSSYRITRTAQTPRGEVQVQTLRCAAADQAWGRLRALWLTDVGVASADLEARLVALVRQVRHGAPGFRSGSPVLRTRAEAARDDFFSHARWSAQSWQDLARSMPDTVPAVTVPPWLDRALDDLAQGHDDMPTIESWLQHAHHGTVRPTS